jgi:hypothetical protein
MRWATLLVLAACATGRVPRVPGDPPPAVRDQGAEREYQALLDRVTETAAVYDNLDSKLFFRAVWQSPTFVEARVRREAMFKDMPPPVLQARLDEERARIGERTEILFAVHANDPRTEDFSRPATMWRIALVVRRARSSPAEARSSGIGSGHVRSSARSYSATWSRSGLGYRLRFPHDEAGAMGKR